MEQRVYGYVNGKAVYSRDEYGCNIKRSEIGELETMIRQGEVSHV